MKAVSIETHLSAARTHLILDYPFLGALVLRLDMQTADWCRSIASDARKIFYNPDYVGKLTIDELQFVLAHEALHCALLHFSRRGHRNKRRWDIACDFAVNSLLIKEGLTGPEGILFNELFDGMAAEEIYPCLDDLSEDADTLDEHSWDQSGDTQSDQLPSVPLREREALETAWRQRLAGAAQQAMQAGKLSQNFRQVIDSFIQSRLPWRNLLSHYMNQIARADYSYARINQRRGDPSIYPSLRSRQINLAAAIDVSGSISDKEVSEFSFEVNAIKSFISARVTLLICGDRLSDGFPKIYEPWETLQLPTNVKAGGGTDFRPVFDWIGRQDISPDVLVYLTDACGKFPSVPPLWPVVWLVKGKALVPWGQRVQFN